MYVCNYRTRIFFERLKLCFIGNCTSPAKQKNGNVELLNVFLACYTIVWTCDKYGIATVCFPDMFIMPYNGMATTA